MEDSVAPPGWTPAVGSEVGSDVARAAPAAPVAPAGAEAAVRWRIGAAVIDNILVNVGYLCLCLVLHWRVLTPGHVVVYFAIGIAYHLVLEARDGQTIGKRHYGIRVLATDGGAASGRAIAIRSVLRLIDQLPLWYASGLISMVRTGPSRRQRIGDIAADTMVVAVDGMAARKGTPRWMLPAATVVAVVLSAGFVLALAEAGKQPLTATQQSQFVAGCDNSPSGQIVDCQCLLGRLEADGYTTLDKLGSLNAQAEADAAAGRFGTARTDLVAAVEACRR